MLRDTGRAMLACVFAVFVTVCLLGLARPAHAQSTVDLLTQANLRIDGASADDRAAEVAGAGDVNGDGLSDVIVGSLFGKAAYVVFGRASMGTIDLADLGAGGFRIAGASAGSVDGAGDVNGDGLADLVVGAPFESGGGGSVGLAYVVFGKASTTTVELGALGAGGFRIDESIGEEMHLFGGLGTAVSGAGDVNGDGLSDVVVGALFSGADAPNSGSVFVVFGKVSPTVVDLAKLGSGGFRIDGPDAFDEVGFSVAGAGDVNGDGLSDVLVGAPSSDQDGFFAGSAWVVFGKASSATIDLAALGGSGFRIAAASVLDFTGSSVAGSGDVNGDGRADVIVGAPLAPGNSAIGAAFVVFGRAASTPVQLGALGTGGFRIDGVEFNDYTGDSVGGVGDVNGDGLADVVVGAPRADNGGRMESGSAYVVFGKTSSASVPLGALGAGGFRIDGAAADDGLSEGGGVFGLFGGRGVDGAGDVRGDSSPDVILGAPGADNNGRGESGSAYVVSGPGGAEEELIALIELVRSFDLPQGTATSLTAKLGAALSAVRSGDKQSACDSLKAFINQTRAQSGKQLTTAQAQQLLASADRVRFLLACS
jgi:FG-GAP repeat